MLRKRRLGSVMSSAVGNVIEGLERRKMLSASVNSHGLLIVQGTPHADTISVAIDSQDTTQLDVTINGAAQSFASAGIIGIKINGGGGGDTVTIAPAVTLPAVVIGAGGNDSLTAGGGNETLNGGAGDDTIVCGTGTDQVNGGAGKDNIQFNDSSTGVSTSTVPASVQTGLSTLAQGTTISSVQPFVDNNHTYYGANVSVDGQATRIVVDSSGNPVGDAPQNHGNHSGGPSLSGPGQSYGIFGTVVSVDATGGSITLSAGNPWGAPKKTTLSVTSSTTINADGATVALSSLIAGTLICIQTSSTDATTATSITAIDPRIGGTATAIDASADTITITDPSGTPKTFTFTSVTTVTLDGSAGTISAITTGAHVQLALSALGGTVLSINSDTQDHSGGGEPEIPEPPVGPGGKVVAIDTTADTITLQNGVGIQTTYTLNSATTVSLDGASSTLSTIIAGDFAQLQLASDGTTVTGIEANDQVKPPAGGGGDNPGGDDGDHPAPPAQLFGSIISVDSAAGTIKFQPAGSGTSTTYALANGATVTLDGATSTLSAVVAGDNAHLVLSADGTSISMLDASDKINPSQPPPPPPGGSGGDDPTNPAPDDSSPKGLVVSVDIAAGTITLKDDEGTQTTYTLASSATVTLDGAAGTLSAVVAGDHAKLTLISGATTVASVDATDQPPPPPGGPGNPPGGQQGSPGDQQGNPPPPPRH